MPTFSRDNEEAFLGIWPASQHHLPFSVFESPFAEWQATFNPPDVEVVDTGDVSFLPSWVIRSKINRYSRIRLDPLQSWPLNVNPPWKIKFC